MYLHGALGPMQPPSGQLQAEAKGLSFGLVRVESFSRTWRWVWASFKGDIDIGLL